MGGAILPRLALLSLAGILMLAAGKGKASDAKPDTEKPARTADLRPKIDDNAPPQKPDVNVIIDRVATRFGAFVIIGGVSYPMQLIADAFGRARRAFPENPGEVIPDAYYYSVTCLATLLTATAMLVAFLTILPAFSSIRVKRMWLSALLALPMGGVAMLYVFSSSWFSDKTT
ncbi:hypothetical protein [Paracoccus sulfuroxidans]|nr:hypothetical protein [Paracoccus sulfuroxidans]